MQINNKQRDIRARLLEYWSDRPRDPSTIVQPEEYHITQEQLVAEVKGI